MVCASIIILGFIIFAYPILILSVVDGGIIFLLIGLIAIIAPSAIVYFLYKHSLFPIAIIIAIAGITLPVILGTILFENNTSPSNISSSDIPVIPELPQNTAK